MRYLSLFSGIEAATVAWQPLGWEPLAFAEVDKFASAVLAHHYPDVPNLGDVTKHKDWPAYEPDVIVGSTRIMNPGITGSGVYCHPNARRFRGFRRVIRMSHTEANPPPTGRATGRWATASRSRFSGGSENEFRWSRRSMPANKKPRKAYRPKPIIKPLGIRNHWLTEGDAHAILLAMEGDTFAEQHLADLVAHANVVSGIAMGRGDDLADRHCRSLMRVAIAIQERNLKTGTIKATELEEAAIRASMQITIEIMRKASNQEILRAAETVLKRMKGMA